MASLGVTPEEREDAIAASLLIYINAHIMKNKEYPVNRIGRSSLNMVDVDVRDNLYKRIKFLDIRNLGVDVVISDFLQGELNIKKNLS